MKRFIHEIKCTVCGKLIVFPHGNRTSKTCSKPCYEISRASYYNLEGKLEIKTK